MNLSHIILLGLCSVFFGLTSGAPSVGLRKNFTLKDLEPILSNPRTLNQYVNCLIKEGPCTADAKLYKDAFPLALQTACGACTETEKAIIKIANRHVYLNDPKTFKKVMDIYDPTAKYQEAFIEFVSQED